MKDFSPINIHNDRYIMRLVRDARKAENLGQLNVRDNIALDIFTTPKCRAITDGSVVVDTFWDVRTRSFITQVRRHNREIRPAVYSHKENAPVAHLWAIYGLIAK